MARQSIPANPVDEQILALQRTIANNQNEMEMMREQFEEQMEAHRHTIEEQTEQIKRLMAEKEQLSTDIFTETVHRIKWYFL